MIMQGPDTGSVITTTKTVIEVAMVNRSFRKSATPPSSVTDTDVQHSSEQIHINTHQALKTCFCF